MAIKSVQAIVNGVTTTLTYDSASKTYKATRKPVGCHTRKQAEAYGKRENRTGYHNLFSDSITVTYEQSADNFIHSHR